MAAFSCNFAAFSNYKCTKISSRNFHLKNLSTFQDRRRNQSLLSAKNLAAYVIFMNKTDARIMSANQLKDGVMISRERAPISLCSSAYVEKIFKSIFSIYRSNAVQNLGSDTATMSCKDFELRLKRKCW
jgi:hypothetical protein